MARKTEISRKLQQRAEQMIPGGVNSPVRAFGSVGGDAPFIVRGQGSLAHLRCRWQRVYRLRRLVGAAHSRARSLQSD